MSSRCCRRDSFDRFLRIANRLAKAEAGSIEEDPTIHAALALARPVSGAWDQALSLAMWAAVARAHAGRTRARASFLPAAEAEGSGNQDHGS